MAGTILGGKTAAKTNKMLHGNNFYRDIGRIGGKWKSPTKGFGSNRELAHCAGKIGGLRSRRGPVKTDFRTKQIAAAYKHLFAIQQRAEAERTKQRQREAMTMLQ